MSDEEPRRFSDEMLWRLDERVRMHIEWIEKDHKNVLERIKELEKFRVDIEKPVHAAGWIILGLIASFIASVGAWIWRLITKVHVS